MYVIFLTNLRNVIAQTSHTYNEIIILNEIYCEYFGEFASEKPSRRRADLLYYRALWKITTIRKNACFEISRGSRDGPPLA